MRRTVTLTPSSRTRSRNPRTPAGGVPRVAKPGVEGLYVELYVDKSNDAVNELVKAYEKWKAERK